MSKTRFPMFREGGHMGSPENHGLHFRVTPLLTRSHCMVYKLLCCVLDRTEHAKGNIRRTQLK